jgi:hypothetical protein
VCEKLAKGELSYDEYKANFKKQSWIKQGFCIILMFHLIDFCIIW